MTKKEFDNKLKMYEKNKINFNVGFTNNFFKFEFRNIYVDDFLSHCLNTGVFNVNNIKKNVLFLRGNIFLQTNSLQNEKRMFLFLACLKKNILFQCS